MLRLSPSLPLPSLLPFSSSNSHLSYSSSSFSSQVVAVRDHHQQLLERKPHLRSSQLLALEYADLNLSYNLDMGGHVRIRQHVNPLSSSFPAPAQVPDWNQVFADPALPLIPGQNKTLPFWLQCHSTEDLKKFSCCKDERVQENAIARKCIIMVVQDRARLQLSYGCSTLSCHPKTDQ